MKNEMEIDIKISREYGADSYLLYKPKIGFFLKILLKNFNIGIEESYNNFYK